MLTTRLTTLVRSEQVQVRSIVARARDGTFGWEEPGRPVGLVRRAGVYMRNLGETLAFWFKLRGEDDAARY